MTKILGFIWALLGLIGLIFPGALRDYLKRKISRRIMWIIYGFLLLFSLSMIGSVIRAPGLAAKIVGILGIIIVVKIIMLMLSKASGKLWDWWLSRPLIVFRVQGLILILIGVIMLKA